MSAPLVDAFHAAGLKVVLDMVVNHTGYHNDVYRDYPDKVIEDGWFNRGTGEIEGPLAGLPDLDHDQVRDLGDHAADLRVVRVRLDTPDLPQTERAQGRLLRLVVADAAPDLPDRHHLFAGARHRAVSSRTSSVAFPRSLATCSALLS